MNCTGERCLMQFDKVDPRTCKCVSYCPQATPPKTNADRIRSMTDEELERWFSFIGDSYYTPHCGWLRWLKLEAPDKLYVDQMPEQEVSE